MVNRGGRSKGCTTCRARKVKCDEKKPFCERCLNMGVLCGGYIQFAEFVVPNSTQNTQKPSQHPRTVAVSRKGPQLPDESTVYVTYLMEHLLLSDHKKKDISTTEAALLPMPSFRQSAVCTSTTHRLAIEALAAAYFGKIHRDQDVMRKGAQLYVQTLASVHSDLSDGEKAQRYETLASILCLGMYENIILSSSTAWLAHFDGISRIVKIRGPEILKDDKEMDLFRRCRFAVIVSALMRRRHCFLKSSPWKGAIKIESAEDHIHEIFAEVPGILHDFSKLLAFHTEDDEVEVKTRVEELVCNLHRWERCWTRAPEPFDLNGGHRERLSQDSTLDACLLALQKAIFLCLGNVCESLSISLRLNTAMSNSNKQEDTPEEERLSLAVQICHLAERCLQESPNSGQRPFLFVFPLQVASRHLRPGSEESVKAVLLMEYSIADAHGFELGRPQISTTALLPA